MKCSAIGVLLATSVANASLVIDSDTYAQQIANNEVVTANIIKGQYSFLDVGANLEFIRADVMVGGYCTNAVVLGLSECGGELQNTPAPILTAGNGWALGEGNQLKLVFSYYSPYYIWPGAYGSSGNVNSYYFDNVNNDSELHSSENGQTNAEYLNGYNTFAEFVDDIYGWTAQSGSNDSADILGIDPFHVGSLSNMVFTDSYPFRDYNIRHNIRNLKADNMLAEHGQGLESSLVVVRAFNGEFLNLGEASNVSVPFLFSVLVLPVLAFGTRRNRKCKSITQTF
jgi:hypothetical protein